MKKALLLAILLSTSVALASSVSSNGDYSLKVGETVTLSSGAFATGITLTSISTDHTVASIDLTTGPNCQNKLTPCPLMMPSQVRHFDLKVGQSIDISNSKITVVSITSDLLTFHADVSSTPVPSPKPTVDKYTLNVGQEVTLSSYNGTTLSLKSIEVSDAQSEIYPPQTRYLATLNVHIDGGCGTNADPRCLGMPAFDQDFTIYQGQTITAFGMKLQATTITSGALTFVVSNASEGTYKAPLIVVGTVIKGEVIICTKDNDENCSICSGDSCHAESSEGSTTIESNSGAKIVIPEKNVEIQSVTSANSSATTSYYNVIGIKHAHFLFLIPVDAEVSYTINVQTGSTISVERPWWSFFLW